MAKVRFAPSPTGYLHIGGARTALFNWMYARNQGGKFVLRIEDTDLVRSKKEYLDEILASMQWLGLEWDELYKQSDRFDIYRQYAQKLLSEGKAHKDGEAVILETPPDKEIKFFDLIRGEIKFDTASFVESRTEKKDTTLPSEMNEEEDGSGGGDAGSIELKDQVLLKSDGSPTYSFACVVDDALMEITHVIRGEDHISNTPKQILMYEALGFKPPKFAHLPLIMSAEGGRMSKRHGAVAVSEYKQMGFLPEAIVNYLMLLGWSPGQNQEIIGLSSAVSKFSIKKINKAAAVFSMEKLTWLNSQYIKQMSDARLADLLVPLLQGKGLIGHNYDRKSLESIVKLYKTRIPTLNDFLERTAFLFVDSFKLEAFAKNQLLGKPQVKEFQVLGKRLEALEPFDVENAERVFREVVAELGISAAELVHPVRLALTGSEVGPGLFETMTILGKEKTIQRLATAFN